MKPLYIGIALLAAGVYLAVNKLTRADESEIQAEVRELVEKTFEGDVNTMLR